MAFETDPSWNCGLIFAARLGRVDDLRLCLNHGASIDVQDACGRTPYFIACQEGHIQAAVLCLEEGGANIGRATASGLTPLHIACFQGHVEAVRLCCDHGADVGRVEQRQRTPLYSPRGYAADGSRRRRGRDVDISCGDESRRRD